MQVKNLGKNNCRVFTTIGVLAKVLYKSLNLHVFCATINTINIVEGYRNQCGVSIVFPEQCSCHPICDTFFGPCCPNYSEYCGKNDADDDNDDNSDNRNTSGNDSDSN